jgi:hypothetical protein
MVLLMTRIMPYWIKHSHFSVQRLYGFFPAIRSGYSEKQPDPIMAFDPS